MKKRTIFEICRFSVIIILIFASAFAALYISPITLGIAIAFPIMIAAVLIADMEDNKKNNKNQVQ